VAPCLSPARRAARFQPRVCSGGSFISTERPPGSHAARSLCSRRPARTDPALVRNWYEIGTKSRRPEAPQERKNPAGAGLFLSSGGTIRSYRRPLGTDQASRARLARVVAPGSGLAIWREFYSDRAAMGVVVQNPRRLHARVIVVGSADQLVRRVSAKHGTTGDGAAAAPSTAALTTGGSTAIARP
jgi:hypothetical protein